MKSPHDFFFAFRNIVGLAGARTDLYDIHQYGRFAGRVRSSIVNICSIIKQQLRNGIPIILLLAISNGERCSVVITVYICPIVYKQLNNIFIPINTGQIDRVFNLIIQYPNLKPV